MFLLYENSDLLEPNVIGICDNIEAAFLAQPCIMLRLYTQCWQTSYSRLDVPKYDNGQFHQNFKFEKKIQEIHQVNY